MLKLSHVVVVVIALSGAAWLTACAGAPNSSATGSGQVQVTLTDFKVESSTQTFSRGVPYRFTVVNKGKVAHEFMIVPPMDRHMMTMAEMDKLALGMITAEDLPTGATRTLELTIPASAKPGKFELACFVPGHYEAGMRLEVVVE